MFRVVLLSVGFLMVTGQANALAPDLESKLLPQQLASYDGEIIDQVMMEVESDIGECYQQSLKENLELNATMQLKVMVYQDGSVIDVEAQKSSLKSQDVEECIEQLAYELTFPSTDGFVIFSYPIYFSSGS